MMEQCGIDDLTALSEEELGNFFTLANEAFIMMNEVMENPQEALSKKDLKAQANMVARRKEAREKGQSNYDQRFQASLTRAIGFGGKSKASKRVAAKETEPKV